MRSLADRGVHQQIGIGPGTIEPIQPLTNESGDHALIALALLLPAVALASPKRLIREAPPVVRIGIESPDGTGHVPGIISREHLEAGSVVVRLDGSCPRDDHWLMHPDEVEHLRTENKVAANVALDRYHPDVGRRDRPQQRRHRQPARADGSSLLESELRSQRQDRRPKGSVSDDLYPQRRDFVTQQGGRTQQGVQTIALLDGAM